MDPITHGISGAALARAFPKRPLPRTQLWLLIGMAMAPDLDYVLRWFSDELYLAHHRGVTHSILMLPLWTWLVVSLLPKRRDRDPALPWLIGAAIGMHILLDVITSFGTMILAPLSDWRASLDLVFIIDPIFTGLMLLPLLMIPVRRKLARPLAAASLTLMFAYIGLCAVNHQRALALVDKAWPDAPIKAALPLPFSPFHWQLIAAWPDHDMDAAVDLLPAFAGTMPWFSASLSTPYARYLHPAGALQWRRLTAMTEANAPDSVPGMAFYRWFARFPVVLHEGPEVREFGDLRFGAGMPDAPPAFSLRLEMKPVPKAWLVWHGGHATLLR
ncbi:MAG TPA: metal-dependent hydrolase [Mariprofundaceae bacterium]|nr:metal-dependent hydrolase [Mariprofundaceae bacterium]